MLRRLLPVIAAASAVTLIPAGTALAHDRSINATCEGLSVQLTNYSEEAPNVNTVQIWVDGAVVAGPMDFGTTFSHTEPFADPTVDHTYRVQVTATMFPNATFDITDTVDGCPPPSTSTTTTLAPTTTSTTTTSTTVLSAVPPSPSTTAVASAGAVGTTTLVAPAVAALPPAPAASPASATLPATGAEENNIALAALGTLLVGGLLTAVALRSRPRT